MKHIIPTSNLDTYCTDQDDFVVFAKLNRDHFDEILETLTEHFEHIRSGRQGDDWIWIHLGDDKIEIDSFYSMEQEVKGKYKYLEIAKQLLQHMEKNWTIQVFDPPRVDITR